MKFEPKISGTKVTDFEIKNLPLSDMFTLQEVLNNIHRQETMNYILDTLRFIKTDSGEWLAWTDYDGVYKIAIMENYPEYEEELIDYFGEKWFNHYIRFNH